jgi:ribose-phosphate pyrophosphokinase
MGMDNSMKLFLTASTNHLKRSLLKHGCDIGRHESYFFADRERSYCLKENVEGKRSAIVASILPAPESLFELLALYRILRDNGAARIIVIIPYLGYARQDRPNRPGEAGLGGMVAELLQNMKPSEIVLFDVHSDRIRKAFGSGFTELSALPLLARAVSNEPPDVIVSPDAGSVPRAERLADLLEPRPLVAFIDKFRPRFNVSIAKRLHGDVHGKNALVVDDMIDTGGTLAEAVKLVSLRGARSINLAATHGIFSSNARNRLSRLPVDRIWITNTLPQIRHPKIRILNIVPLLVGAAK